MSGQLAWLQVSHQRDTLSPQRDGFSSEQDFQGRAEYHMNESISMQVNLNQKVLIEMLQVCVETICKSLPVIKQLDSSRRYYICSGTCIYKHSYELEDCKNGKQKSQCPYRSQTVRYESNLRIPDSKQCCAGRAEACSPEHPLMPFIQPFSPFPSLQQPRWKLGFTDLKKQKTTTTKHKTAQCTYQ